MQRYETMQLIKTLSGQSNEINKVCRGLYVKAAPESRDEWRSSKNSDAVLEAVHFWDTP